MGTTLARLLEVFEELWPVSGAEDWDAAGLVSGAVTDSVSRVLLTVDVTSEIITEAIEGEFDLVLAHHPFLMRGVTTLSAETAKGSTISRAIKSSVAIYAAHTNADIVADGVSDTMAKRLGLVDLEPLAGKPGSDVGHGRIGKLLNPATLGSLARHIATVLPSTATGVRVAGDYEQQINRVALCAGAGDSFMKQALDAKVDVFITSDLRHHVVQDARESAILNSGAPAVIDVSHWAAEWLWLDVAAAQLASRFPNIQFVVSHIRTDPWDFVVTQ